MIISLKFREQLSGFLAVVGAELDNIVATLRAWSNVEHNDDGTHSPNVGNILQFMAGANIGAGQPVYVSAGADQTAAGQVFLADASAASKSTQAAVVGLATIPVSAGANVTVRDRGIFSGLVGLQAGKVYYLGTTPGSLTLTAPTNAVLIGLAISPTDLLILLRNPITISGQALVTWTGTTSGSQNLQSATTLAFTSAGTYSITVNTAMTLTFKGSAAGGGANSGSGNINGGAGGGGGATTTGTTVALVPAKTYTLIVGAGGAGGAAINGVGFSAGVNGGVTTFVNTTDAVTLVSLAGGGGASAGGVAGTGGALVTGSNGVTGGAGAAAVGSGDGPNGSNATNGCAGGGGGSASDGSTGGNGGTGSATGGAGGVFAAGGNNGGLAGGGGDRAASGAGGGGGGGGSQFSGVTGGFGGGGGGGGGAPNNGSFSGVGGTGGNGAGVFVFVSAP